MVNKTKRSPEQRSGLKKYPSPCREDAQKAVEKLRKSLKTLQVDSFEITTKHLRYKTKGRPKTGAVPEEIHSVKLRLSSPLAPFQELKASKGRFVLATNELDEEKLPYIEVLTAYKGQAKVERGLRFLKDPQFVASNLFVKKPERVEALLLIMTLCLTVYAAIEYRIRQQLAQKHQTIPLNIKEIYYKIIHLMGNAYKKYYLIE